MSIVPKYYSKKPIQFEHQSNELKNTLDGLQKVDREIPKIEQYMDNYISSLNECSEKICQVVNTLNDKHDAVIEKDLLEKEVEEFNFTAKISNVGDIVPMFKIIRNISTNLDLGFTKLLDIENNKNGQFEKLYNQLVSVNETFTDFNTTVVRLSNFLINEYTRFVNSALAFNFKPNNVTNNTVDVLKNEFPFLVTDFGLTSYYYLHFLKNQKIGIKESKEKLVKELQDRNVSAEYIQFVQQMEVSTSSALANKCFKFPQKEDLETELHGFFTNLQVLRNVLEHVQDHSGTPNFLHVEDIAEHFFQKYGIKNKQHFDYFLINRKGTGVGGLSCLEIAKEHPDKFFFTTNNCLGGRKRKNSLSKNTRNKKNRIDPYEISDSEDSDDELLNRELELIEEQNKLANAETINTTTDGDLWNNPNSKNNVDGFFGEIDNFYLQNSLMAKDRVTISKISSAMAEKNERELEKHHQKLDIMFEPFLKFINIDGSRLLFNSLSYYFMSNDFNLNLMNLDEFLGEITTFGSMWSLIDTFFGKSTEYLDSYLEENFDFENNIKKTMFVLNSILNDANTEGFSLKNLVNKNSAMLFPWKTSFRDYAIIVFILFKKTNHKKLLEIQDDVMLQFSNIVFSYPLNSCILQPHFLMLVFWLFGNLEKNCANEDTEINQHCVQLFNKLRTENDETTMVITSFILIKIMDVLFYSFNESDFFKMVGETEYINKNTMDALMNSGKYGLIKNANEFEFLIPTMLNYIKGFEQSLNINNLLVYDIVNSGIVNEYMVQADIILSLASKIVTDVAKLSDIKYAGQSSCYLNISTFKIIIKSLYEYFKNDFYKTLESGDTTIAESNGASFINSPNTNSSSNNFFISPGFGNLGGRKSGNSNFVKSNKNIFYARGHGVNNRIFEEFNNKIGLSNGTARGQLACGLLECFEGKRNLIENKYDNIVDLYINAIQKSHQCFVYEVLDFAELKRNHQIECITNYTPLLNNNIITNIYKNFKKTNDYATYCKAINPNTKFIISTFRISNSILKEVDMNEFINYSKCINPENVYKFKSCLPLKMTMDIDYKIIDLDNDNGFAVLNANLPQDHIEDYFVIDKELNTSDWDVWTLPDYDFDENFLTPVKCQICNKTKYLKNDVYNTFDTLQNHVPKNFDSECNRMFFVVLPSACCSKIKKGKIHPKELLLTLPNWNNVNFLNNFYSTCDKNKYMGLGGANQEKYTIPTKTCSDNYTADSTDYLNHITSKKHVWKFGDTSTETDISLFDYGKFLDIDRKSLQIDSIDMSSESMLKNYELLFLNIEMQHKKFSSLLDVVSYNTQSFYNQLIKSLDKYIEYIEILILNNMSVQYFLKNVDQFFFDTEINFLKPTVVNPLRLEIEELFKNKNMTGYFTFDFEKINKLVLDNNSQLTNFLGKNTILYNFFLYFTTINSQNKNELVFKPLNLNRGVVYYFYFNFVFFYQILCKQFELTP